MLDHMITSAVS